MFNAILLSQDDKRTRAELARLGEAQLPVGNVKLRIEYSTLNYKDALAMTGRGLVVKSWPMVPGIDLAGVVERSAHPVWQPGQRVVVTGWGLGETRWGGLAQKARLDAECLLPLPSAYTPRQAMAIGTAGFTAALCAMALQRHGLRPDSGEVLVTGAAGGVGSIAVALLAGLGYTVVASTGRSHEAGYLRALGAARIVDRAELSAPGKAIDHASHILDGQVRGRTVVDVDR
ncbi:alcohol dehydrogenase catalytic domain-containing protein [Azoarcus sp. DD4]|uniref:alcohol dehydrogenase catalytic domain-containing protein n=1 Tax=Azoarcus sp. DD4 TaxID=2027405 RepID=UPI0011280000